MENHSPVELYMLKKVSFLAWIIGLAFSTANAATPLILTPRLFELPGKDEPTPWLLYANPAPTNVMVAGSWDKWTVQHPMQMQNKVWAFDMRTLGIPFGRYEFKFITNGQWESGANRVLYANMDSELEIPSPLIARCVVTASNRIDVFFSRTVQPSEPPSVYVSPETVVADWHLLSPREAGYPEGYTAQNGIISFRMAEKIYGLHLSPGDLVTVAGNFNGWKSQAGPRWTLRDADHDGVWELSVPLQSMQVPPGEKALLFKFVVNGKQWLFPPHTALNYAPDGAKNANLRLDPALSGSSSLIIKTLDPLDPARNYVVTINGLASRPVHHATTPEYILNAPPSVKEMGVVLDKEHNATTYRLFAPRATDAYLCLYETPDYQTFKPSFKRRIPRERYRMWKDPEDSVWEISLVGLDTGAYYSFNVEGPSGEGEGFSFSEQIGDPYARAAAHAENNTIVIDPDETNEWFTGWTDQDHKTIPRQDAVIYETHVRHLTFHPSSGVPAEQRGKYDGITASDATDTGLNHLRSMGINTIEFLPLSEFNNDTGGHNWGYTTVFYFAPEASYAHHPLKGSQYFEYKTLVNQLHREGFGVIMDVVYNHVGWPNIFSMLDRKYFFRLNDDFTFSNFSGCGNDVRTEAPMMRRLIVDNILYWMKEFHVDGFRFDLAELIDMDTMRAIEKAARAINPNVQLISEPWSLRGENKQDLTGTGWSAWNNEFRYAAKDFIKGKHNREWLKNCIFGSMNSWAATPLQSINYLESHDDMTLADELCSHPDRNGKLLTRDDVNANRLGATILFTSLGIPMICEGQEFIRHKEGLRNTYDAGDRINAIDWDLRKRPMAEQTMEYYRGLIQLRSSPEGASLRLTERPPKDYYRWIEPADPRALGYIINADGRMPGRRFIVLLNASFDPANIQVPFPAGRWRMIGNGKQIDLQGVNTTSEIQGPRTAALNVPGLTAIIFMDEP